MEAWGRVGHRGRRVSASTRSTKREQSLENLVAQRVRRVYTRSENADDSSFLLDAGYFRPATIFEGDSSRGFAAVLVRVCARWPTQHRRRRGRRRRGTLRRPVHRKRTRRLRHRRFVRKNGFWKRSRRFLIGSYIRAWRIDDVFASETNEAPAALSNRESDELIYGKLILRFRKWDVEARSCRFRFIVLR